MNIIMFTVF